MNRFSCPGCGGRTGGVMLEISVAIMLLSFVIVIGSQLTLSQLALRRSIMRGEFVQQEAANVLERIYFLPWAEITETRAQEIGEQVAKETGAIECTVTVAELAEPIATKRIEVIARATDSKSPQRRVRLSAWRFNAESEPANVKPEESL